MECSSVAQFKGAVENEEGIPINYFYKRAQSFWIHPLIFLGLDPNKQQKAGELVALALIATLSDEPTDSIDRKTQRDQVNQLLIFLWAVENLKASKVSFNDASSSKAFDSKAQTIMAKLDPQGQDKTKIASAQF